MSNYNESKKAIDKIRSKYNCAGDVIMKTAVQYVVRHGQESFEDQIFIEDQIQQINDKHMVAEAEGKHLWIAKDFELAILNCARELAEINTYDLIIYMQKEMFWSQNEGGLDYGRLKQIATRVMDWIVCDSEDYDTFSNECDIEDYELEELGFGYMIPEEEEDEKE